ncbi:MAG: toll/interleukin-1 receptor domain-containing protein [Gaiellaceae bacterium]
MSVDQEAPSLTTADETPRVFLSYRRADTQPSAILLYKELAARFGHDTVCMDIYSIPGSDNWLEYIERTLGKSALVLAVIGPNWLTATDEKGRRLEDPLDVLRQELELALKRDVRLIPLLVQGATMPRTSELPEGPLRGIVDRFPVTIGAASIDEDIGGVAGMVERILEEMRANVARGLADQGDFARARETAELIGDERIRQEVLDYIAGLDHPEPPPPGVRMSVRECLDGAGLKYHDAGEAVVVPFGGQRTDQVLVFARELTDGTAFFSVEFDPYKGKKKNKVKLYQLLLGLSFAVDYVKGIALSEGRFAIAAEIPPGALTPESCDGIVRGLVALGDVGGQDDLISEESWQLRIQLCRFQQEATIKIDEDRARAEMVALLEAAGARVGSLGYHELDLGIGEGARPVSLHVSSRVISVIQPRPGKKPGDDVNKLTQLLELNRAVNVAKVGLDSSGDVGLLYELPAPVPDVVDRLKEQFSILIFGLILRL